MIRTDIPLPYNKARLVVPSKKSKDQRWHISYYVWDGDKQAKIRVRDFYINQFKTIEARKAQAKIRVNDINKLLATGYHIDTHRHRKEIEKEKTANNKFYISVADVIGIILLQKEKHTKRTYNSYFTHSKIFISWLDDNLLSNIRAAEISEVEINNFLHYLKSKRGVTHRTYNNYLSSLKTIFNEAVFMRLMDENPCSKIKKLKSESSKNAAYTDKQIKELTHFMLNKTPHILTFCKYMYYTLMRTRELSSLRVGDINRFHEGKIYLRKEFSKNRHERHVGISSQLKEIIASQNLQNLPPEWYIFSRKFLPGPEQLDSRYFGKWYRKYVLQKLGYNVEYTIYSWKHTSVCKLFKAGMKDADIYQLGGWLNWVSFQAYMRSLGMYDNSALLNSFPDM